MGLASIDPRSQKEHTKIHKIPKFGVNRASFDEIQAFKNVKNLQRNEWKSGQIRTSRCALSMWINSC